MMDKRRQKLLCTVLLVLNLGFIWGNSLLPADASQALSDGTGSFMGLLLHLGDLTQLGSVLIRKAAHFAEFAALGMLLAWQLWLREKNIGRAVLWGLLTACIDESIQFFVPGRAPGLLDVAIDVCGAAAGMILLQTGYRIVRRKQTISFGGKQL